MNVFEKFKGKIKTGLDLVLALAETGTPDHALAPARVCLAENNKATPAQVLAEMQASPSVQLGTLQKAMTLLDAAVPDAGDPAAFPVRAPEGGCKIGEVSFAAGAVVPQDQLDKATPDENLALRRIGPAPIPVAAVADTPPAADVTSDGTPPAADPGTPSPDAASATAAATPTDAPTADTGSKGNGKKK